MNREFDDEALGELEVVIPNLNWRYSGGTAVNRTIAPLIAKRWRAAWLGPDRPEGIEGLSLGDLMRLRFRPPSHRKVRIWHARRNVEMLGRAFPQPFRLPVRADLQFGLPAPDTPGSPTFLIARMDAVIATSEMAAQYLSSPGDRDPSRHRRRSLFPARRPARGLRRDQPAGKYGIGTIRPGPATEGNRSVRRGDVPAPAAISRFLGGRDRAYDRRQPAVPGGLEAAGRRRRASTERIRFLGELPIEEVPRWYQRISIYVFASRVEGFGLTMLEAMAAGDAVVAARAGAAEMVITDGDDGVLAPVGDADALVSRARAADARSRTHRGDGAARAGKGRRRFQPRPGGRRDQRRLPPDLGRAKALKSAQSHHVGHVILHPLSSTVPATSAPLTTLVTLKRSSGSSPLAWAVPT